MRDFDLQLLRLKEVLGVTEDQDAAQLLGLTKHAFSDRKRRGSFPVDKLQALRVTKPELNIDSEYVLTGRSPRRDAEQAKENYQQFVKVNQGAEEYMHAIGVSDLKNDEYQISVLIYKYRQLNEKDKVTIDDMIDFLLAKNKGE